MKKKLLERHPALNAKLNRVATLEERGGATETQHETLSRKRSKNFLRRHTTKTRETNPKVEP